MIHDCFMLNDEIDLLECRLTELQDVPDLHHVIVEARVTHRGQPKPLNYPASRERFTPWADRITYIVADSLPPGPDPWVREHAQREYAWHGLADAAPDDVILHGDLDEIPRREAVEPARSLTRATVFGMRHFMYAADWQYPGGQWPGTIAVRLRDVQGFQWLRAQRFDLPVLPDAGWHLSWLGGVEAQRVKLGMHCHLEMTREEAERIASGRAYAEGAHHGGHQMIPVDVDSSWPRWITGRKCPGSWFRPREGTRCA